MCNISVLIFINLFCYCAKLIRDPWIRFQVVWNSSCCSSVKRFVFSLAVLMSLVLHLLEADMGGDSFIKLTTVNNPSLRVEFLRGIKGDLEFSPNLKLDKEWVMSCKEGMENGIELLLFRFLATSRSRSLTQESTLSSSGSSPCLIFCSIILW